MYASVNGEPDSLVALLPYEADRWYKLRFDFDLDQWRFDVFVDDVLRAEAVNISAQLLGAFPQQVEFGTEGLAIPSCLLR